MSDIELYDITEREELDRFNCEDVLLNLFLQREAYLEHVMHLSRTKLIKIQNELAGFFTIEIRNINLPIDEDDNKYSAIVLKCLAVDKNYENYGIGTSLLEYITLKSKEFSEFAGCRCLFIDARVSKLKWYRDRGFQFVINEYNNIDINSLFLLLNDPTVEMFIDFRDGSEIKKLFK